MIHVTVGDCGVDILPVVNGIMSECDRVREAYGGYEAYAASMGIEGIQAIRAIEEYTTAGVSKNQHTNPAPSIHR